MKRLKIIHLGIGNVGKELVRLIQENREKIKNDSGVNLVYWGMFNSRGGIFRGRVLVANEIKKFPVNLQDISFDNIVPFLTKNYIVIDTTASDETYEFLDKALQKGCSVAVSNKKPLCRSFALFESLVKKSERRFFYETTVGAGLPVIKTLKTLLGTGDKIIKIQGCFSGTLGYIFSELEKDVSFSQAVAEAYEKGFTEPDPRDDLSGLDVARKALILNRILGKRMELSDIKLTSLYPKDLKKMTVDEFLRSVRQLNQSYSKRLKMAKSRDRTLRFVATITEMGCTVGLTEVDQTSDLGSLKGSDNFVLFQTKRYDKNPLIIKGPGAGIEVTAAGLLGDIFEVVKTI